MAVSLPKSLLTIALCFGLGLGLAPLLRAAHACSCVEGDYWLMDLEQIDGEGELSVEQEFWSSRARLDASWTSESEVYLSTDSAGLLLRHVP